MRLWPNASTDLRKLGFKSKLAKFCTGLRGPFSQKMHVKRFLMTALRASLTCILISLVPIEPVKGF